MTGINGKDAVIPLSLESLLVIGPLYSFIFRPPHLRLFILSSPYLYCCLDCVIMRDALAASTRRVVCPEATLEPRLASFRRLPSCRCTPVGSIAMHEIQKALSFCQVHAKRAQGMRSTIRLPTVASTCSQEAQEEVRKSHFGPK